VLSLAVATAEQAAAPSTSRTLRLPEVLYRYSLLNLPAHFSQPAALRFDNTPANNPVTDQGATLGRMLFYDTRLSANNTISCGSCHVQSHAFVDPNRFSKGFKGGLTDRHTMNLVNLRTTPGPGSSGTSGAATSRRWCCCRCRTASRWARTF
jgi:cytochrome c peroxidase